MDKMQKIACLAAYCALAPQGRMDSFDALAEAARQENLLDALREQLTKMDVPVLLRRLNQRRPKAEPLGLNEVRARDDGQVFWRDTPVGAIRTLYKPILPTEWQARIAYDSFITRFLRHIQSKQKVAVLAEDEFYVRLFIPAGKTLNLGEAWQTFVQEAFSTQALLQTFVLMLNSGRLSARGGFSTPRLPILTRDQARVMAALLYASMDKRKRGLARLEENLAQYRENLSGLQREQSQGWEKKAEALQKKIAETNERLTTQRNNYGESIQAMAELETRIPEPFEEVRQLARAYNETACHQLKVTAAVVRKYVEETERLLTLSSADYYPLPPLLLDSEPVMAYRAPGDYSGDFCYLCGRAISNPNDRFEANKLILASPSQTLQTRTAQTQPWVCGTCAALAMASPVKLTGDNLIVLLREGDDGVYLYEDHLRMLVLGELNIVAGKYLSVRCTEKIDNKLFIDALGAEQYALYKVALTFPADVLGRYRVEAILGGALLELPARHLVWLRGLIDVFNLNPYAVNQTRGRFATLGQAIRYVQKEELVYAIYTLASVFTAGQHYSAAQANQLEALRADHLRRLQMEEKPEASRFRDVAALTGMLVAFASYVRQEATKLGKKAEREVEKLLEKVDNPNHFTYEAAGSLPGTGATLWRSADNYFIYDEAAKLLERLGVVRAERETVDGHQRWLQFYFDDIVKAYTLLFEEEYRTEKARREFTYELKLSLYSRFPEYLKSRSSSKEG